MTVRPRNPKHVDPFRKVANDPVVQRRLSERQLSLRISALEARVTELEASAALPKTREQAANTDFKGWPSDEPAQYNGSASPCDMWTGPCSCGAWHSEGK